MAPLHPTTIALFDVDGTLTPPRKARAPRGLRVFLSHINTESLLKPDAASRAFFSRSSSQQASPEMLNFLQELRKARGTVFPAYQSHRGC
jgi:FMN phosphatase YigB (HAD superfamily)